MTNKQIISAQKVLRVLESTPIIMERDKVQVTYDMETYNDLLGIITDVANTPLKEYGARVIPNTYVQPIDYHREKI